MALTLKFKRRRNKKKKVNCQLIENPKVRRGPHKMPSRAACRVFETSALEGTLTTSDLKHKELSNLTN